MSHPKMDKLDPQTGREDVRVEDRPGLSDSSGGEDDATKEVPLAATKGPVLGTPVIGPGSPGPVQSQRDQREEDIAQKCTNFGDTRGRQEWQTRTSTTFPWVSPECMRDPGWC